MILQHVFSINDDWNKLLGYYTTAPSLRIYDLVDGDWIKRTEVIDETSLAGSNNAFANISRDGNYIFMIRNSSNVLIKVFKELDNIFTKNIPAFIYKCCST